MAKKVEEPKVTSEDLRRKLGEIQDEISARAHRKVLGVSYLALGGIVLGAGALGLAFWLGRRSGQPARPAGPPQPGESYVGMEAPQLNRRAGPNHTRLNQVIEPVVDTALRSAVNAITDRLTYKPSCEARL